LISCGSQENDDKGPTEQGKAQQEYDVIKDVVKQVHSIPPNRLGQSDHGQDFDDSIQHGGRFWGCSGGCSDLFQTCSKVF
jgi:hypothetical protein